MPALSPADAVRLIALQVRDVTGADALADPEYAQVLETELPLVWNSYLPLAAIYPDLQFLYTKRAAVELVLGQVRDQVDIATAADQKATLNQLTIHLRAMYDAAQTEIARIEAIAWASHAPVMAQLAVTGPGLPAIVTVDPATGRLLPSVDLYRGSPFVPSGRRWW
jgi:putative heme iron utilization protein